MGIKGLIKLINEHAGPYAIKKYSIDRFRGMTVAIDASAIVYQSVLAVRTTGQDMKNSQGNITSHLHGIIFKILKLLEYEIIPIFVFDGKPPNIKSKTIQERNLRKQRAENNINNLSDDTRIDDETFIKNFKNTFRPTKQDFIECRIMLDLMGIPYVCAPGEADVICAWLAARTDQNGRRYVKGVCADDSDILTLGSPYIFKDMLKFINKGHQVTVVSLHKTLIKMNITMDQFVDLCVLLGCDYCDNIRGIGPKTAYKYIMNHENIDKIIKLYKEKNPDIEIDTKSIREARDYFKNALEEIDRSDFTVTDHNSTLRKFQYDELIDFMCVKHGFDVFKIENCLNRLSVCHSKMNITKENNKSYHTILQQRSIDYMFFSSSDTETTSESESKSKSDSGSDSESESNSSPDPKTKYKKISRKMKN